MRKTGGEKRGDKKMIGIEFVVGVVLLFGVVPAFVLFLVREAVIGRKERKNAKGLVWGK